MKILLAGPWTGSLLGELLCWQGWLRAKSRGYNKTIVLADPSHRAIYADFASSVVSPENEPFLKEADRVRPADVPVQWVTHQPVVGGQEFVTLGKVPDEKKYHLTIDAQDCGHLDRKGWARLICKLPDDLDVAWASDGITKCHQIGGEDVREADFPKLLATVLASKVVIGPSGGIAALASVCRIPFITWVDKDHYNLYPTTWNPRATPGIAFRGNPSLKQLEAAIAKMTTIYDPKPEPAYSDD